MGQLKQIQETERYEEDISDRDMAVGDAIGSLMCVEQTLDWLVDLNAGYGALPGGLANILSGLHRDVLSVIEQLQDV